MTIPHPDFSAQIPAIYARAISKYEEITDEKLDTAFLAKLQNVDDLTREIDARNTQFSEFREKRGVIFDVLKTAMIPVELFGSLAAGGASMVFPPSSLVFGAVTYLMSAAKGVSRSYDAISELMGSLKDFTIRLKTYSRESISADLGEKLSDILVTLIEIFALSTKTIRRGRLLKFTRNFLLGNNDAIQAAMGKLDKLTGVEDALVGAETLTESKRTGRVVDGIEVTVSSTNATVLETGMTVNQMSVQVGEVQEMLGSLMVSVNEGKTESSEEREKALQAHVLKVLRPSKVDHAQDWYDKIHKSRIPGTGDWVREEDVFKAWLEREDTPVIFVSGNPGAGKSYLSANIISFLKDRYPQHVQSTEMVSVGYFFFKDDNPETRSLHQALRDLAFQISKNDPVYQKYLASIEDHEKISTLEGAWRLLFVEYFIKKANVDGSVYILFDAVDEAYDDERRTFLSLARDLYEVTEESRLQIALVGRPHISDQLLEGLEVEVPTIYVTTQKNSGDINSYIQASIKKSPILRRVSAKLRAELVEKLSAGAEGMFLWVNLMLQELVKKRNESSMRKALEHPPKGLKEILRHVLSSFSASSNDEELEYFNEILAWVTCSEQPLTLEKIDAILKLKSPEGDGMIYLEGALRRQFASFFVLDREDGLTTAELQNMSTQPGVFDESDDEEEREEEEEEAFEDVDNFTDFNSDSKTTTATFCHASIGDFFRDETEGKVSAGKGHIAVGVQYYDAKAHVLKTLLRLFVDKDFASKADDRDVMLRHAARTWVYHLENTTPEECSLDDQKEISRLVLLMVRSEEVMVEWVGRVSMVIRQAYIDAVRKWWKNTEVFESLPPEDQEFIRSTEADPVTTFKPLTMFSVKKWVREDEWQPWPVAAVVWSYKRFVNGAEVGLNSAVDASAKELIEAAEFGDSEKTGQWYRRCAMVLRQRGHHQEAMELFSKALELQPDEWLIRAGMAYTYFLQREWQKAIALDVVTVKILKERINEDENAKPGLHFILERMAECYKQLENPDGRLEALKGALENAPHYCKNCTNALLELYATNGDHTAAIKFLKELADAPMPDQDISTLTQAIWDNPDGDESKGFLIFAADAALATDNLDFLVQSWRTAAKAARKALKTVTAARLELAIARIYSEFMKDQAKAVKRWEKIMTLYSSSKDETAIGVVKLGASYELARAYLCNAFDAGVGTPEATAIATKLEKLANTQASADSVIWTIASARAICLGVYYRLSGQIEKAQAQFRPSIKRGIQILSDDDPENDVVGLWDLMTALVAAGDSKNVTALAQAISNFEKEDPEDNTAWTCDGPCRRSVTKIDGMSLCPICMDTGFCAECLKLLEGGTMGIQKCNQKHVKEFLYIPERTKEFDKGQMLVDGEVMEFDAWRDQLKKEWRV
ncbi:NACHT and TPR domain protein [Aspergillus pseudodeflectus]|uniref:NACHT and TPR domain protein n=1 Tax=Aspergillus pseudodeflectus TaxID=176178 RepID=A0ABR4JST9_9EURO